jgi:HSP20 family protein
MVNFFEKLKRGMGVDETPAEKEVEEKEEEKTEPKEEKKEPAPKKTPKKETVFKAKPKKEKIEKVKIKKEPSSAGETEIVDEKEEKGDSEKREEQPLPQDEPKEVKKEALAKLTSAGEGQLAVDVYQTKDTLVIQSAIAGITPDSLDVSIEGDMVTIKGVREKPQEEEAADYFYQECFWGPFSRQIVLSVEVDPGRTEAILKDGILTVKVPKIERQGKRKIQVIG